MEILNVIVANEPRSYRNVMSRTFGLLRPDVPVFEVEPEDLAAGLTRCKAPCLVVCSLVSRTVRSTALSWIELYPTSEPLARCSVAGRRFEKADPTLLDLLFVIDQTLIYLEKYGGSDSEGNLLNHSFERW